MAMDRPARASVQQVTRLLCCTFLFCALNGYASTDWKDWKPVGEGQLTRGFWTIYDSELRTPSGAYEPGQGHLALIIRYRQNIKRNKLLAATGDQWRRLRIGPEQSKQWLNQLQSIWPDIKKGDQLTFVITPQGGTFYQYDKPLGDRLSIDMSQAFIAIWLSPDTAFPKLRRKLMGR